MCFCIQDQMKFVGLVGGYIFRSIDQLIVEEVSSNVTVVSIFRLFGFGVFLELAFDFTEFEMLVRERMN